MEILIFSGLFIFFYLLYKSPRKIAHFQIMSYYNKDENKIIMPSNIFFNIRHRGGYMANNGLFFRNGYQNNPVYNDGDNYIEVELKDN